MDLFDQRDSKGQMSFISFKEGFPKDYLQLARNVLNQPELPAKFPQLSSQFGCAKQQCLEHWEQNICADTCATARANRNSATSAV